MNYTFYNCNNNNNTFIIVITIVIFIIIICFHISIDFKTAQINNQNTLDNVTVYSK